MNEFAKQTNLGDFRKYLFSRFFGTLGIQILSLGIVWHIYLITKDPLHLGFVGLAQFIPIMLLTFSSGALADQKERHTIVLVCHLILALAAFFLCYFSTSLNTDVWIIYCAIVIIGVARSFLGPAIQSFIPHMVASEEFSKAVAKSSSVWQFSLIIGPSLGGFIYSYFENPFAVYLSAACLLLFSGLIFSTIQTRSGKIEQASSKSKELFSGLKYVYHNKEILGSISLDLFAVLLGGAVALLPIYADSILHVGAKGLGLLRAAPGIGAALTGLFLSYYPIKKNAGKLMFLCVAMFGVLTVCFSLSRHFLLSLFILFAMGAFDLVSVVIRMSLVQLKTPSQMRGKVSAVNTLFISASNELGEFESGLTAKWFGTVEATMIGGIGTLLVALIWYRLFPKLKEMDQLH